MPGTRVPDREPEIKAGRQPRRRKRIWRLVVLAVLAVATLGWLLPLLDRDGRLIELERKQRRFLTTLGMPLPGTPDLANLEGRLTAAGVKSGAPIFMRIFKREFELELWMLKDGRYERFATYPICRWSGRLGPKLATGDKQAPEGFYSVDARSLNPNSRWHRSFNLGFPNAFDRAHGRTGSFLMVHGGCGSVGCYAMTNPVIDEIWRLTTEALNGGQKRFQVQVFPFRMTDENLRAFSDHPSAAFWRNLKSGYDLFEQDRLPPAVGVCSRQYVFRSAATTKDVTGPVSAQCISPPGSPSAARIKPRPAAVAGTPQLRRTFATLTSP